MTRQRCKNEERNSIRVFSPEFGVQYEIVYVSPGQFRSMFGNTKQGLLAIYHPILALQIGEDCRFTFVGKIAPSCSDGRGGEPDKYFPQQKGRSVMKLM